MSHASVVMVRCPTTGRELSTGVEMDAATLNAFRHSLADQVSPLPFGSYLVNARSLARQSSSFYPRAPLAVHQ